MDSILRTSKIVQAIDQPTNAVFVKSLEKCKMLTDATILPFIKLHMIVPDFVVFVVIKQIHILKPL